ncbi:MAG: hypothetical protein M1827_007491 [Pycnora praestabilis]|nr:MAG: hypothetical protein M1827_007491 [Pycnora praestabilis]
MTDHPRPRVNLPVVLPTPPMPGAKNAFAQRTETGWSPQHNAFYDEAKRRGSQNNVEPPHGARGAPIMPSPPKMGPLDSPPNLDTAILQMRKRPNVQPAVPLSPTYSAGPTGNSFYKHRAVTEPIRSGTPKPLPLFSSPKAKAAEMKNKFSKDAGSGKEASNEIPPTTSLKAAAILGARVALPSTRHRVGQSLDTNKPLPTPTEALPSLPPSTPSASAPATTTDFVRGLPSAELSPFESSRQTKSTPGPPTLRFYDENHLGKPTPRLFREIIKESPTKVGFSYAAANESESESASQSTYPPQQTAMILGDGHFSPTRGGTYGRLENVNVIPPPVVRVPSVSGVIEYVGEGEGEEVLSSAQYEKQVTGPTATKFAYSPSIYGGGFDEPPLNAPLTAQFAAHQRILNDPRASSHLSVLSSYPSDLSAASPIINNHHDAASREFSNSSSLSRITVPIVFNGHASEITPTESTYPAMSHPSAMPEPLNPHPHPHQYGPHDYYPEANATSTSAGTATGTTPGTNTLMTPRPLNVLSTNLVPPHPSFPGSSLPSPSAELFNHIMGLHHHLGASSASLTHSLDAKHDNVIDHLVRKYEGMRAVSAEYAGDLRAQMGAVEHNLGRVAGEVKMLRDGRGGGGAGTLGEGSSKGGGGSAPNRREKEAEAERARLLDVQTQHDNNNNNNNSIERLVHMSAETLGRLDELLSRLHRLETRVAETACRCGDPNPHIGSTSPRRNRNRKATELSESDQHERRRSIYAEIGRQRGEPDLREHPAFAEPSGWVGQGGQGIGGAGQWGQGDVVVRPSFSDGGWYREAYSGRPSIRDD